jgi:hypothetical protein
MASRIGECDDGREGVGQVLTALGQASASTEPREGPFGDPPSVADVHAGSIDPSMITTPTPTPRMGHGPRQNHRRRSLRASSVRFRSTRIGRGWPMLPQVTLDFSGNL